MKCVIPCAGSSSRMAEIPKTLIKVNEKPVLRHIIDFWTPQIENFIFVVRRGAYWTNGILDIIPENSAIVFQDKPEGLADAVRRAEPYLDADDNFLIALGDCIYKGRFKPLHYIDLGIGVWETENLKEINKSYLVSDIKPDGSVVDLIEKPSLTEQPKYSLRCGMGVYVMDSKLFDYSNLFFLHPSSEKGGGDLTEIIDKMAVKEYIEPMLFDGEYINITDMDDLREAERILK